MLNSFLVKENIDYIEVCKELLVYQCLFNSNSYHLELFQKLSIVFPDSLSKAVSKRQSEYLAGRYIAHFALRKLGVEVVDIASDVDRSPKWPIGITGSITHSGNKAVCAVGHNRECEFVGIDLELWMDHKIANDISRLIVSPQEIETLAALGWSSEKALTLAFSAKESLFKALYPIVRKQFGFEAARLTKVSLKNKTFTLQLTADLSCAFPHSSEFSGCFIANEMEILTIVYKTRRVSQD